MQAALDQDFEGDAFASCQLFGFAEQRIRYVDGGLHGSHPDGRFYMGTHTMNKKGPKRGREHEARFIDLMNSPLWLNREEVIYAGS